MKERGEESVWCTTCSRREARGRGLTRVHAPGLAGVLRSGRFRVTGSVYFNPLKPFDLQPTIPESEEAVRKKLIVRQEIPDFEYSSS